MRAVVKVRARDVKPAAARVTCSLLDRRAVKDGGSDGCGILVIEKKQRLCAHPSLPGSVACTRQWISSTNACSRQCHLAIYPMGALCQ